MLKFRSVFPPGEIITPDDVRGHYDTLNDAVLHGNWPTLASARGKVVFLMDQRPVAPIYLAGHPSLRGRVLFTNAEPGMPDAAFIERNDGPASDITTLVRQGLPAETAKTLRTPASADQVIQRPHPLTSPGNAVDQIRIAVEQAFDFARQEGAVIRMIEARISATSIKPGICCIAMGKALL